MTTSGDIFLAILSFIFPPLGVWVKRGICSCDSLLNILLCCLGFIPGLIHAWYIIAKYPDEYEEIPHQRGDAESQHQHGRVVYVHVANAGPTPAGQAAAAGRKQQPGGGGGRGGRGQGMSYGTVDNTSAAAAAAGAGPAARGNQGGEGMSGGQNPPPSYAEAVKGDHKVQGP